jgi:hypothetical protein
MQRNKARTGGASPRSGKAGGKAKRRNKLAVAKDGAPPPPDSRAGDFDGLDEWPLPSPFGTPPRGATPEAGTRTPMDGASAAAGKSDEGGGSDDDDSDWTAGELDEERPPVMLTAVTPATAAHSPPPVPAVSVTVPVDLDAFDEPPAEAVSDEPIVKAESTVVTVHADPSPGPDCPPISDSPEFMSWLHRRLRHLYPTRGVETASTAVTSLQRLCEVLQGKCLPRVRSLFSSCSL